MSAAHELDRVLLSPIDGEAIRTYLYPGSKSASSFATLWATRQTQLVMYYERILELRDRLGQDPTARAKLAELKELELAIPVQDRADVGHFHGSRLSRVLGHNHGTGVQIFWRDSWIEDIFHAMPSIVQLRIVAVYACPYESFTEGDMAHRRLRIGLPPALTWLTAEFPANAEHIHEWEDEDGRPAHQIYREASMTPFRITSMFVGYRNLTVLHLKINNYARQEGIAAPGISQALRQCNALEELCIDASTKERGPIPRSIFEALSGARALNTIDLRPFLTYLDDLDDFCPAKLCRLLPQVTKWRVPLLLGSFLLEDTRASDKLDLELYDYPFRQHHDEPHDWEDDYVKHALDNIQLIKAYLQYQGPQDMRRITIIPLPGASITAFRVSHPEHGTLAQVGSYVLRHQVHVANLYIANGLLDRPLYPQVDFRNDVFQWMRWSAGHEGHNIDDSDQRRSHLNGIFNRGEMRSNPDNDAKLSRYVDLAHWQPVTPFEPLPREDE